MLHSRKSFLQLLGLASISPVARAQFDLGKEAMALAYVQQIKTAQGTYHSLKHRYTERIEELNSVAKLPELPDDGWRLVIAAHGDKWDVMLLQESTDAMDTIIFVTDQTGMIRRGSISPVRSFAYPTTRPSA